MADPDQPSIERLLQHESWLRELAVQMARNGAEQDELLQETWLMALRQPPADLERNPRPWLRRVLQNAQRQMLRRAWRRIARESRTASIPKGVPTPLEIEEQLDLRREVMSEVQALGDPHRQVLMLRYFEDLSLREIATRMDAPLETLKSQHARALTLLRERLNRREGSGRLWLEALVPTLPWTARAGFILMNSSTKAFAIAGAILLAGGAAMIFHGAKPGPDQVAVEPGIALQQGDLGGTQTAEGPQAGPEDGVREEALVLASGSTISSAPVPTAKGRVLMPDGRAVPFAKIACKDNAVTADRLGRFAWPIGESPEELIPIREGMSTVLSGWVRPHQTEELTLVLAPSLQLGGQVKDGKDQAVPRATLKVELSETWARNLPGGLSGGAPRTWKTTCDEFGFFEFPSIPALDDGLLWVRGAGYTSLYSLPRTSRSDLVLVLSEPTVDEVWAEIPHLSGRVLHNDGEVAAKVEICAAGYTAKSDSAGLFRFPLSLLRPGLALLVLGEGHLPFKVTEPRGQGQGWPDFLEIRLPPEAPPTIQGRVEDTDGKPLEGRAVWIVDPTPIWNEPYPNWQEEVLGNRSAQTDAEGYFSLTALFGRTYRVAAFDRQSLSICEVQSVRAGAGSLLMVLERERTTTDFRGRCVSPSGEPMPQITLTPTWKVVEGELEQSYTEGSALSDELGEFVFESIPATFDSIDCEGPGIVPQTCRVTRASARNNEVLVYRRADIRVRTVGSDATHFMLYNEEGQAAVLHRFQWIDGGAIEGVSSTSWGELKEGRSSVYTVMEGTWEVRLFNGAERICNRWVDLSPGKVQEVALP